MAQIGNHLPGYIDDLTLVLYERDWSIFVCFLVIHNSSYYQCAHLNWAQELVKCLPLSDGVGHSVVFLSFERDQNAVRQMKRWRVVMYYGFSVFDEGNISEAQLLYLPLLCFRYLCVFARAHYPEVGSSCKFTHCLVKFCGF